LEQLEKFPQHTKEVPILFSSVKEAAVRNDGGSMDGRWCIRAEPGLVIQNRAVTAKTALEKLILSRSSRNLRKQ
jgi:hypothetical protein